MAFAPFTCALGDSPEVELQAGATVDIAPGDDSVDSNRVRIVGTGTITSLGIPCGGQLGEQGEPQTVTKRIYWLPTAPGTITLQHNPPFLCLLGAVNRTITGKAFSTFCSDATGYWQEDSFALDSVAPIQGHAPIVSIIYYTASATITIPVGATRAWVRMWGGSGGSGSVDTAPGPAASGGTGPGAYLEKFLTGLSPGNTLVFTFGAAGVGGVSGAGGNGGFSKLESGTQTITTLTANGSNGSVAASLSGGAGTIGGTATGGDVNLQGSPGGNGFYYLEATTTPPIWFAFVGRAGVNNYSVGADGVANGSGKPGRPGGLIIAWFNDALS